MNLSVIINTFKNSIAKKIGDGKEKFTGSFYREIRRKHYNFFFISNLVKLN